MPFSDTAPIEAFTPDVATTPLSGKFKRDHFLLDEIDWFWRNFFSDDDKGLYAALVDPVAGDYARIAENGKAWMHTSKQFQNMSKNLTDNTSKLLSEHWVRGEAASAYQAYIEINWVGALFIAEQLSECMGKGFAKLSEWSVKLAEKIVDLLGMIVERILKLARKFVGPVGAFAGAIEWISSGFEDFPYWSDVQAIIGLIDEVQTLHRQIENLADSMKAYFQAFEDVFSAIKSIPEINSTQDVAEITSTLAGGKKSIEERRREVKDTKSDLDDTLG